MFSVQSTVKAFGLEQPCIQDPLKASQCWFLHLDGQDLLHPGENLLCLQPRGKYRRKKVNKIFKRKIYV